jgi:hypothetical protein
LDEIRVSYKVANLDLVADTLDALPFGASATIKGDSSSNDAAVTSNQISLVCDTGQPVTVMAAAASLENGLVTSEESAEPAEATLEDETSEAEEPVALAAAAPTLSATVGSTSADIITGKNGNLTASITADKESYAPGDTATFTVTLNNATGSDFKPQCKKERERYRPYPRASQMPLSVTLWVRLIRKA